MIVTDPEGVSAPGASPQQRAVMGHGLSTPALVDAGAGTGKTFTIVERVAQLAADPVNGCAPSSVLLLTFSKKAAAELRSRIIRRLGPGVQPPECATFHAFALSLLKEHGFELTLSPDSTLVNDVDARVEFWHVFEAMVRGELAGAAAEVLPLRFVVIDAVRASLFDICQRLRDRGTPVAAFRENALEALAVFARTDARVLFDPKNPLVVDVEISDADFRREVEEERRRIEAAAALFSAYDERLRERQALTYSDLLHIATGMIAARPELARSLQGRFRHCIVDEYQDTDPRQIRLLEAIFGGACDRVMVVGDPRQTIYGFRGIDPSNLQRFADKPGCIRYSLSENRRSRQEILDLAHSVIHSQSGDPEPLRAVRDAAETPVVHARSHWIRPGDTAPNAAQARELEARWVAAKIVELLSSGRMVESPERPGEMVPLAPRHIAILNRRKTQLQPLIEALNERDIPFRQYGGAGFYDAPEVLDALAWLRLVTDPLDDEATARALSSPSVGLSDASLLALCRGMRDDGSHLASRALVEDIPEDLDADTRERIQRFRRIVDALEPYSGSPIVIAWEAALDRAGVALSADIRSGHRHDQASANLEKLSAMVRGFAERNPGARPSDFDRYIRELRLIEADDQEADPPSADAVNVMTIHAAKGLEWPIVFAIDVWPSQPPVYTPVWVDEATGALLATEGPDGAVPFHTSMVKRGTEKPPDGQRERDREERRLFYVAVTRARDELYVSGRRSKTKNGEGKAHDYLEQVIEWIGQRGWRTVDEPATAEGRWQRAQTVRPALTAPLRDYVVDGPARRSIEVPALSFSAVARFEECPRSVTYRVAFGLQGLRVAPDSAEADADTLAAGEPARDALLAAGPYGEMVHRALETWARTPGRTAQAYVSDAVRDLGVKASKAERERATTGVGAVIAQLQGWEPLLVEAPFTLDLDDVSVTGFIDLVARDPSGRVVIIDYKTGITEAAHYALQLALYRIAVKRAYALDADACAIVRISDAGCALETVSADLDDAAVRSHVAAVAAGIRSADVTARPGPQCATCPYRAAPCQDFV